MTDLYASIREDYKNSVHPNRYDSFETWEELLPCKDGVRLRTLYYRPKAEGPIPCDRAAQLLSAK